LSVIKISDVAAAAGVSVSTVSQVLNGNGVAYRIATKTIERVQHAARNLGFVPNTVARDLRAKRTGQIGVILSGFQDPGIPLAVRLSLEGAFLLGLTLAARERGLPGVVIYPTDPSQALEPHLYLDGRVDGLLVQNDPWGKNLLRDLAPKRLPVVGVWTQDVQDGMGFADVDHQGGAVQVVEHLLELGHRRIALLGPTEEMVKNNENFRRRYAGFHSALLNAGITSDPRLHVSDHHGVLGLLDEPDPITAVFAVNDRRAISLVAALQEAGVRVPQDLSIVGFDNVIGTDLVAGGLTTVDHPVLKNSVAALENLMALIEGKPAEQCRTVVPTTLLVRNSSARVGRAQKGRST
jgi:DNA-binding LacI/PurR family transcriptional regulator